MIRGINIAHRQHLTVWIFWFSVCNRYVPLINPRHSNNEGKWCHYGRRDGLMAGMLMHHANCCEELIITTLKIHFWGGCGYKCKCCLSCIRLWKTGTHTRTIDDLSGKNFQHSWIQLIYFHWSDADQLEICQSIMKQTKASECNNSPTFHWLLLWRCT